MSKTHMVKTSYDGYYVGVGVEHPGIIVSAESEEELVRIFRDAIPSHKRALKHFGVKEKPDELVVVAGE